MRRQYLFWTILVFGIVGVAYGTHLLIYHYKIGNGLSIPALIMLILGGVAIIVFLIALISRYAANHGPRYVSMPNDFKEKEEEVKEEVEEEKVEPVKPAPKKEIEDKVEYAPRQRREYVSSSIYDATTVYVKQVGYGPLLRVCGNRILDMRDNNYYRIEGNLVKLEGSGPMFEIRGDSIKNAFGGYLYEISGGNINKTYGGFYASISGNYITLYDLSMKFELSDSLSKKQLLAVVALLFGTY